VNFILAKRGAVSAVDKEQTQLLIWPDGATRISYIEMKIFFSSFSDEQGIFLI
jgi:hypothetical protein